MTLETEQLGFGLSSHLMRAVEARKPPVIGRLEIQGLPRNTEPCHPVQTAADATWQIERANFQWTATEPKS